MSELAGEAALPPAPPRMHPLVRSFLYLVAFFALQLTVSLLLFPLRGSASLGSVPLGGLARSSEFLLFAFPALLPPLLAVTLLFLRLLDRRPLSSIGLRLPRGGRSAALRQAVAALLGATALLGLWTLLLLALPDQLAKLSVLGLDSGYLHPPLWWPGSPLLLLLLLQVCFLLQGWVEEWVLRGYIYSSLRERWGGWPVAVLTSLLFAALHADNPAASLVSFLNIFLAGMILAGLVERSGSLWSAALAHGAWNFAVACLLSLPVSGYSLFHLLAVQIAGSAVYTGGGFGPEGSLLLTPLLALLAAALWRESGPRRKASIRLRAAPCSAGSGSP